MILGATDLGDSGSQGERVAISRHIMSEVSVVGSLTALSSLLVIDPYRSRTHILEGDPIAPVKLGNNFLSIGQFPVLMILARP